MLQNWIYSFQAKVFLQSLGKDTTEDTKPLLAYVYDCKKNQVLPGTLDIAGL